MVFLRGARPFDGRRVFDYIIAGPAGHVNVRLERRHRSPSLCFTVQAFLQSFATELMLRA